MPHMTLGPTHRTPHSNPSHTEQIAGRFAIDGKTTALKIRAAMTAVVVLQPGYLPWLGFFDQLRRSDIFVYYDDVQYDKGGWRNRNRVKSSRGPVWLTVPVLHTHDPQPINAVCIDARYPWQRKHLDTIAQLYANAPFIDRYLPSLRDLLLQKWELIADLDIAVVALFLEWLGLRRVLHRSSTLGVGGPRSERLLNICRHFGADRYISGNAAQSYLDVSLFEANGISVEWQNYRHPEYAQLHGPFEPYLSTLDLLLNVGEASLDVIASGMTAHEESAA
jgi:hypothetical protein